MSYHNSDPSSFQTKSLELSDLAGKFKDFLKNFSKEGKEHIPLSLLQKKEMEEMLKREIEMAKNSILSVLR